MSQSQRRVPACFFLSSRCFKISRWVSLTIIYVLFNLVICANFNVEVDSIKPLKSRFSVLYSFIDFLYIIPIGLQSQVFWGSSPVQDLWVGVPDVDVSLPMESSVLFELSPGCGSLYLGSGFSWGKLYLCLFHPCQCVIFVLC